MGNGRFGGKVAVVTGGGSGMGRAIALRLAAEGADVAIFDIDRAAAEETVSLVREQAGQARAHVCDITAEHQVAAAMTAVLRDAGRLHVLVNNAGVMHSGDDMIEHTSDAAWEQTFAVNLFGPLHCCQHALPHLLASGAGAIVTTASVGGVMGTTRPVYGASKGALIGMTTAIARQYAADGLRANVVLPAGVNTPMLETVMKYQRTVKSPVYCPQQRVAQPDEIAGVVAFLASADAAHINGSVWPVDGGTLAV